MKIAVLVSGGVDSAVALRLLQSEGRHDLTAFYLKVWLEDELSFLGDCPWEADLEHVRAVCSQAHVPLEVLSLQAEYLERVVTYALDELREGRTPSPDLFCNRRIKFGAFFERIGPDFERVATGHYARIDRRRKPCRLLRAPDPVKDQTYFLSGLKQDQVYRADFPIGHLLKPQVRDLAAAYDLPNKDRKDSQGICFLGKISYPDFIRFHLGEKPGDIVDLESGKVLGRHQGFWFYTVGQRQGLGLGGGPWYVVRKEPSANVVYVSHATHRERRARNRFTVRDVNWIAGPPDGNRLELKLRHGPEILPCEIETREDGRIDVRISESDSGIASGQFAVFYDGEVCLGSGAIE